MKTIALAFMGLILFGQEPDKKVTVESLQSQVTKLQQTVEQKDQQIESLNARLVASGKMFSACFQDLADAEQRAAHKPLKPTPEK